MAKHCKSLVQTITLTKEQVINVEEATRQQNKTKFWNMFCAGRITASKARAAVKTNPDAPSLSLIKTICYPQSSQFVTQATTWGSSHEEIARKTFVDSMQLFHENFTAKASGYFIDQQHPFIGASPDAIVSCDCCGTLFEKAILSEIVSKLFTRKTVLQQKSVDMSQNPPTNQSDKDHSCDDQPLDTSSDKWCYCQQGEYGKMVCCDNQNCKYNGFTWTVLE